MSTLHMILVNQNSNWIICWRAMLFFTKKICP